VTSQLVYQERVSSAKTTGLFGVLTLLFLLLLGARLHASGFGYLAATFLLVACFFAFYAVNYRTLMIGITAEALLLKFGVFRWTVPWSTVADAKPDDTPIARVEGAGIHFTMRHGRYWIFFNFLGHPRIVLELKKPRGPVRDVAFSTRQPGKMLELARELTGSNGDVDAAYSGDRERLFR